MYFTHEHHYASEDCLLRAYSSKTQIDIQTSSNNKALDYYLDLYDKKFRAYAHDLSDRIPFINYYKWRKRISDCYELLSIIDKARGEETYSYLLRSNGRQNANIENSIKCIKNVEKKVTDILDKIKLKFNVVLTMCGIIISIIGLILTTVTIIY